MAFPFKKKNKNKFEPVLIFDIGSGSVAGAIAIISENKLPQIVYSARESLRFTQNATEESLLIGKNAALTEVLMRIQDDGLAVMRSIFGKTVVPEKAFCFLASPWFHSRSSEVGYETRENFVLTSSKLCELFKIEEDKLVAEMMAGPEVKDRKVAIIDRRIQSAYVNGYLACKLVGRRCGRFKMSLFQSATYLDIIERIERSIYSFFNIKLIGFHSFALPLSEIAKRSNPHGNYLMVDITGQVTDIYVVRRGEIRDYVSLPFGRHTLIRKLAQRLNVPPQVAHSSLKIFLSEKADNNFKLSVEKEIIELQESWREMLRGALNSLYGKYLMANEVYVTADEDTSDFFINVLASEKIGNLSVADGYLKVYRIGMDNVKDLCGFWRFKTQPDPFLAIEANFIAGGGGRPCSLEYELNRTC